MDNRKLWKVVAVLALGGMADSLYLLLFQTRKVKRLACPIFDDGCEKVAGSSIAYPAGIPDAIFGVAGYGMAAGTALGILQTSGKTKKLLATAMIIESAVASGLSAFLTYAQPAKIGTWCFWCLISAAISTTMAPIAIFGASKTLREP